MDSLTHFIKKSVYFYVQHINRFKVTVLEKCMQRELTAPLTHRELHYVLVMAFVPVYVNKYGLL